MRTRRLFPVPAHLNKVIRSLLLLGLAAAPGFAVVPRGCTGSSPLGVFRISVRNPQGGAPLAVRFLSRIPAGSRLIWDPVHLSPKLSDKAEVAAIVGPTADGRLAALEPHKASQRCEWALLHSPGVIAIVLGPQGLNMHKVDTLVTRDEDLLQELADYAEQTSEVEDLVQQLADSEDSGTGTDAALKGFSTQYGVSVPKLDTATNTNQQATMLLRAVLPTSAGYDPLAPTTSQVQQSAGLAASVAGLFFGDGVGLAAGGAVLFGNLKTVLFPGTEFRSAFAQNSGPDSMALCTKSAAPKAHTRLAFLWAYRVPDVNPPVLAIDGPAHLPLGVKSPLKVAAAEGATFKQLDRVRDWRLTPVNGGDAIAVSVTPGSTPDIIEVDLSKATKLVPGEYRLTATWDWDSLSIGTIHLHKFGDLSRAQFASGASDHLVQGHGVVTVGLAGTDFEFIDKVSLQKVGPRAPAASEIRFDLPDGKRKGEQDKMTVDIDTASAGKYKLLLAQADGARPHEIPVTVLPPNPKLSSLPLRVNTGETHQTIRLEGTGLDRIESVTTAAGAVKGALNDDAWCGEFHLKTGAKAGDHYDLLLHVQGLEEPLKLPDAIEVVGPRPLISAVRKSAPVNLGLEMRPDELPAGTTVGFVVTGRHLGSRPELELGCSTGDVRKALTLTPDEPGHGASLTFAGDGELYLSVDPGAVGYPGCGLQVSVRTDPEGLSDPFPLGRVVRVPRLDEFTLTSEQTGPSTYAGILRGRDLDLVEKTGWDSKNGLPVEAIPTPVPGDPTKQTLRINLPWPAPAPHSPLYVWLRGEQEGRKTSVID